MKDSVKAKDIIRSVGSRSVAALVAVFLLTIAVTGIGCYQLYRSTKESIHLQGRVNAVQSAKEFDDYLIVRKNTVVLAAHVVDGMINEGRTNEEILEYLTAESESIKVSIDMDYTGIYGWINGEYLDGVGWVPDDDYVPTERPWYTEAAADGGDEVDHVTFVSPYLDEQTGTVLTTMAKELSDGGSVVALDVTLSRIEEITKEVAHRTPGSMCLVLDSNGRVIAHSESAELGKNYLEEKDTLGAAIAHGLYKGSGSEFELKYGGRRYIVFTETIEGNWKSLSVIDTRYFYKPLKIILLLSIIFALLEAVVFAAVLRNQSEKKLAVASAQEAQSASLAKTRFLSRMSHEIRTPINAIIGLDNLALRDETISQSTREELSKIGASAGHLLSIVNDILDMSRIESGRMELKEEPFLFTELIEQICIIAGGQCEEKGLSFVCEKTGDFDDCYVGDNLKLKQAIINILGNSVKFTDPPGTISFGIEQTACNNDHATLCFTMRDTGIGMDEDYIPKLFEAFSQEDTDNTSRYGGSGLGMAITKNLVEMMGGDISVESKKGAGTTFRVTVTLGRTDSGNAMAFEEEDRDDAAVTLEGRHVLIVEDQEMNAEILTDLLEFEGISSEWAINGRIALAMFEDSEEGHFDAILMDMRMPVMDGLTATREIRKLERPDASAIPIIALTANAFEEDVRACLEAGMDAHLSKPVDIGLLKDTLRQLLAGKLDISLDDPANYEGGI